jgi:sugar lactone lactonase YvrE
MKITRCAYGMLAVVAGAWWADAAAQAPAGPISAGDCNPSADLHFVCGLQEPEDLTQLPNSHWIITTGMATGGAGGLFLIDTRAKSAHKLELGKEIAFNADHVAFPNCPSPPDPAKFSTQGLNLREQRAGHFRLNVVSHGTRESIEIFDVDVSRSEPVLTWRGCVPLPEGHAGNSVTSAADGTLYATIFVRPGTTFQQMLDGKPTGDVYVWHVGTANFERLPGLSLSGDNGIELSRDGKTLFVNFTGTADMRSVAVADPAHTLHRADFGAMGFAPDNVHWTDDGQLIVAGMREDEPACGGLAQRDSNTRPQYASCHRAAVVALVDPATFKTRIAFTARQANDHYTGTSTGLLVDGELWIGSFATDRVAYVALSKQQLSLFGAR